MSLLVRLALAQLHVVDSAVDGGLHWDSVWKWADIGILILIVMLLTLHISKVSPGFLKQLRRIVHTGYVGKWVTGQQCLWRTLLVCERSDLCGYYHLFTDNM